MVVELRGAPGAVELDPVEFDAVVFDMDGVITDTATVHARAWKWVLDDYLQRCAASTGRAPALFTDDDYARYVDGRQRQDGVASFLASRGVRLPLGEPDDPPDRESLWGVANRKDAEFQRLVADGGVEVFGSSVALVRALQQRGLGTAIVSASRNCQRVLDAGGVGDLFGTRVDGIDAEALHLAGKPSPDLFLVAAARLGVDPARTVVVEDAIAGVEAGRRGHFGLVIGVDRGNRAEALRAAGAGVVVSDLGEVVVASEASTAPDASAATALRPDAPSTWSMVFDGYDPDLEHPRGALLTLSGCRVGTRVTAPADTSAGRPWTAMIGVYDRSGPGTRLLIGPSALSLPYEIIEGSPVHRRLDLHAGVLHETVETGAGTLSAIRFASLAHPGTVAMRAECPDARPTTVLVPPIGEQVVDEGISDGVSWMRVGASSGGGIAAAVIENATPNGGGRRIDRVGVYVGGADVVPVAEDASSSAQARAGVGFDALLAAHRDAWAKRWADADIAIEGDDELQLATRFALFHLMAAVPDDGEAAVGARGLSGPGYRGHVFWDADTFVLPFLAATRPAAARAMLEYRVRRLGAAQAAARRLGRAGARFPWESAATGDDVTPLSAHDRTGRLVAIRTGQLEVHIVAQVAWAASCYIDWTDDAAFAHEGGLQLLVETARYWASRIRIGSDGVAHIYGVIGPDEYHEPVDDNAFTNVMARWNLRRASRAVEQARGPIDVGEGEVECWRHLADQLTDGYDANTGVYEQFAGFQRLEPLIIEEVAPRRPIAADLLLGLSRVRSAQVLKQADVLMLHHLVPTEVAPDSLEPNLRHYEPRTAHGSSLSPAIHASLFARARDYPRALAALRMASRVDLDDLTGTTAEGLHLATMGGLWQAFAFGFGGLRPGEDALEIDPRLPPSWGALEMRVRFRGSRVRVRIEPRSLVVTAEPAITVHVASTQLAATPSGLTLDRIGGTWRVVE